MDRDGHCAGADPTHTDGDGYPDLGTDGDGHASTPDPQPDSVDRNGYHHPNLYLYPHTHIHSHGNLHADTHTNLDALPACHRHIYADAHSQPVRHPHANLYPFHDSDLYSQSVTHYSRRDIHPVHYSLPHHPTIT